MFGHGDGLGVEGLCLWRLGLLVVFGGYRLSEWWMGYVMSLSR